MTDILSRYSFSDGKIKRISISTNVVEIEFEQWKEHTLVIQFLDCWRLEDNNSVGLDIADLYVYEDSQLITKLYSEHASEGTLDEVQGIRHYSFLNAWGGKPLLEICAMQMKVVE